MAVDANRRALIRFDLAPYLAIPGTTLQEAWLQVFVEATQGWSAGSGDMSVYRLTSPWSEPAATWMCADQTNCPYPWWGASFAPTETDWRGLQNGLVGWKAFDVTADVTRFRTGTPNYGWLLRNKVEDGSLQPGVTWVSSRETSASHAPSLVISYLPDTTPPSMQITAPKGEITTDGSPDIVLSYSDSASGIDVSKLKVTIDGVNISTNCRTGSSGGATCTPGLIAIGQRTIAASIADRAGNQASATLTYTQRFTVEHGYAAAVTFQPSSSDPNHIIGVDASGNEVWEQRSNVVTPPSTTPSTWTWGYLRDVNGQKLEQVDTFGNRTVFNQGSFQRDEAFHYNIAGDWVQRIEFDDLGGRVLEAVESKSSDLQRKRAVLGLTPGVPAASASIQEVDDGTGHTSFISNSFANVTAWRATNYQNPTAGQIFARETTAGLGKSMIAWIQKNSDGSWSERDTYGGDRTVTFDSQGRTNWVWDPNGTVYRVERDSLGRPSSVYLGGMTLLRYTFDAHGRWTKAVIDRRTNEVIFSLSQEVDPAGLFVQSPQDTQYAPRPVTEAWLQGYMPVVEWTPLFPWDGHLVANLSGNKYALIPLDGSAPWRSIYLPFAEWGFIDEVDYTADRMILRLSSDSGGPNSARRTIGVTIPRQPPSSVQSLGGFSLEGDKSISPCNSGCVCISQGRFVNDTYIENLTVRCSETPIDYTPGPDGPGGGGGPGGGEGRVRLPPHKEVSNDQRSKLEGGKTSARQHLLQSAACRQLFSDRGFDGAERMESLTYWSAQTSEPRCGGGAAAFTMPSQPYLWLCEGFLYLDADQAATVLIHETLHTTGLRENPPDPSAQTSGEINDMVVRACGTKQPH